MAEKTDKELKAEMSDLSDHDLARTMIEGSRRKADIAGGVLRERRGRRGDKKALENLIIGAGGTPKNVFRRLTGW